ncbi:transketolase [Conservatibacter flavescens]|uniref:Transketolase n=2 Tax=Conservatibacter flavescens TaxID=28161 RepID=A0A2M8S534_9PAST|nr:transketolase [Conservatibacter flavescens]
MSATKKKLTTSAMIASIASEGQETISAPFGHALVEVAKKNANIVGLTADLAKYTDLHIFRDEFPQRFYQMGMAEQLLLASAGGMAKTGLVPFVTSYAVFATRRAFDFIHQVIAEEHLNVKICAALPGLTTGYGPSHQACEDLALMRAIPNMMVIDPCDAVEIEQIVPVIAEYQGPVYMRLLRGRVPKVLDKYNYQFKLGKAQLIKTGKDVLFVSTGLMTMRVLEAAEALEKEQIDVGVLHVPTIKPLDTETILKEIGSQPNRLIVSAENHTIIGGLSEALSLTLMNNGLGQINYKQITLPDAFLDAGALPTLHERYGISLDRICTQIKQWLK